MLGYQNQVGETAWAYIQVVEGFREATEKSPCLLDVVRLKERANETAEDYLPGAKILILARLVRPSRVLLVDEPTSA
jgi:ABC-type branched-subunit amino acid transport system ATPase component